MLPQNKPAVSADGFAEIKGFMLLFLAQLEDVFQLWIVTSINQANNWLPLKQKKVILTFTLTSQIADFSYIMSERTKITDSEAGKDRGHRTVMVQWT